MAEEGTHHFATSAWELRVPLGVTSRDVVRPPSDTDITTMAVCWGRLPSGRWVRIVIGTRPRRGRSLRTYIRTMAGGDGRSTEVAGAHGARRAEFTVELEDPVDGERTEHVAVVVAAGRREYVTVAISTVGEPAGGEVDPILDSLRLLDV
jgi:hypothetical protein